MASSSAQNSPRWKLAPSMQGGVQADVKGVRYWVPTPSPKGKFRLMVGSPFGVFSQVGPWFDTKAQAKHQAALLAGAVKAPPTATKTRKNPAEAWFTQGLKLGLRPHASGEHGIYSLVSPDGKRVITDADTAVGRLARITGRTTARDGFVEQRGLSEVPEKAALAWAVGKRANPKVLLLRATLAERIALAKKEILADVKAGIVPRSVPDFSTLHNYVDANGYGGWFRDEDKKWAYRSGSDVPMANAMTDVIETWIKQGGLRNGTKAQSNPKTPKCKSNPDWRRIGPALWARGNYTIMGVDRSYLKKGWQFDLLGLNGYMKTYPTLAVAKAAAPRK